MKEKRKSGFEDENIWWTGLICRHRQHDPPMHIAITSGKIYRHICPGCGRETVLRNNISWNVNTEPVE
jgi:predicted RNA-binding Zn-ribbon protein involved in translation (DUF1610 family)